MIKCKNIKELPKKGHKIHFYVTYPKRDKICHFYGYPKSAKLCPKYTTSARGLNYENIYWSYPNNGSMCHLYHTNIYLWNVCACVCLFPLWGRLRLCWPSASINQVFNKHKKAIRCIAQKCKNILFSWYFLEFGPLLPFIEGLQQRGYLC